MLQLLHGRGGVWPKITQLVKDNQRNHVAVAFVSSDAHDLLPLSSGDTLVVDMSRERVRSGATNPSAVRKFVKAGVSVFTYTGLHAKVLVLGNRTVVGSANVSNAANKHLDEAVLVTNDASIRKKAEKYVEELKKRAVLVTKRMLKKREAEFRETGFHGTANRQALRDGWSFRMMKRIARASVVDDEGLRWGPYIKLKDCRAIHRIYLQDSDDSVVLALNPGDTMEQALALYDGLDVDALVHLVSGDDGWEARPNFHLGFRDANLRSTYTRTSRNLRSYLRFWKRPPAALTIRGAKQPDQNLVHILQQNRMMQSSQMAGFTHGIENYPWVTLRPSVRLTFTWDERPSMTEVLSKINEAMGTWGEQVVRIGAGADRTLSVRVRP